VHTVLLVLKISGLCEQRIGLCWEGLRALRELVFLANEKVNGWRLKKSPLWFV
jgi:hypothetical protein